MTTEQQALVEAHMHIAKNKAAKWAKSQNVYTYDELLSTCYMALCKAAKTYDPQRGCHFVGYVSICIDNAVRDELRPGIAFKMATACNIDADETMVEPDMYDFADKHALQQAMQKLAEADRDFLMAYYGGKTQRQLARELGVSQKAVFVRLREITDFLRFQINT